MKQHSKTLYTLALVCVATFSQAQVWLGTNPVATVSYGGAMIDFKNESATDIALTGRFDLNLSGTGGGAGDYRVYVKTSALSGQELSASAWTLLGATSVTSSNAFNSYTTIDVGNSYTVAAGQTIGLAFFQATTNAGDGFIGYRSGANTYTDGTARITTGLAKGYRGGFDVNIDNLFNVDTFSPRTWSGRVEYQAVPEPASLCALGIGAVALLRRRGRKA
jgi:hypothetical protein